MSEWISVKDKKPKDWEEFIGFEDGVIYLGHYDFQFGFFDPEKDFLRLDTSYWMPLPNLPKESKNE
jgi:hypothetical protein